MKHQRGLDNPLCPGSQLFACSASIVAGGGKSFGDDDGRAPHRICRGDCSRLFCVSANRNQPTAKAINGVKNGKSRSTGATGGFPTVRLYRADPCRNFCFHVCLVGRKRYCEPAGRRASARRSRKVAKWGWSARLWGSNRWAQAGIGNQNSVIKWLLDRPSLPDFCYRF